MDKENLLEGEIASRLNRVKKVEIAEPIRCSYGAPDINYFRSDQIYHSSPTLKNLAHQQPRLESARHHFITNQINDIHEYLVEAEEDYWTV